MPTTYAIPDGRTVMAATLYTGTGATASISNAVNGVSFQPDLVWMKRRSSISNNYLQDTNRGALNSIFSDSTSAEVNQAGTLTSFSSNGFSLGTDAGVNGNGNTFVGWQWKAGGTAVTNTSGSITSSVSAGTTQGFSVVTYTGNGTAGATVGHGLGVVPSMIIVKARSAGGANYEWVVQHKSVPASQILLLSNTIAATTSPTLNSQYPSSSVIYLGSNTGANQSTITYVAYCFAQIAGFSAFGKYTGNGSADGPFVYLGFRPRFVMFKRTDIADYWVIYDTSRSPSNIENLALYPNSSSAEVTETNNPIDGLSNGFKARGAGTTSNASGGTYIYMAFAEVPFKFANAR